MNLLRNFFSSIIGSLLVFVIGATLVLFSITSVLFDQKFILATLEKNDTYGKFATEIVPKFLVFATTQRYQQEATSQELSENLSTKIDKTAFSTLEPDLKSLVENSYSFVLGEKEGFETQIELRSYLAPLEQGLNSGLTSLQAEGKYQELNFEDLTSDFRDASDATVVITQDKVEVTGLNELGTQVQNNENTKSPLREFRDILEKTKQTQVLLLVAAIGLVILLFASRLPHFLSGLKWIASTAISAALFPLILGFLLLVFKPIGIISRFLKEQEGGASFSEVIDLLSSNLSDITNKIFTNLLIFSAILIVFGIFLYVLVFFLARRAKSHKTQTA